MYVASYGSSCADSLWVMSQVWKTWTPHLLVWGLGLSSLGPGWDLFQGRWDGACRRRSSWQTMFQPSTALPLCFGRRFWGSNVGGLDLGYS